MNNAPERVDRTHSVELQPGILRVRSDGKRIYAEDFKAELVRQCLIPGTSVAATAMAHRINANLLRRWIGLQGARSACSQSPGALLPVTVRSQFTGPPSARVASASEIIEIDFHGARVRLFDCMAPSMPSAWASCSTRWCKPHWRPIHIRAMCSSFAGVAATSSRCCGPMARDCCCWPSARKNRN